MKLTTEDQKTYESCKAIIDAGIAVCALVGGAMRTIKEREFYLADGYETWESFCAARYSQWSLRYCNQLILDEKIINALPEKTRKLVTSHSSARALASIDPSIREEVIEIATVGGTKPATAESIRRSSPPRAPTKNTRAALSAPPSRAPNKKKADKPELPKDHTGIEIPEESIATWNRSHEAEELLTYLGNVRKVVGNALEENDPLYVEVDFNGCVAHIKQLTEDLLRAVPFAICPECNGKIPADCPTCKTRGFVSEFRYKQEPMEKRLLRPIFIGSIAERKTLNPKNPQFVKSK